jgi:uncharacterized protein
MSQRTAVILGASTNRSKFGNKSVRAHLKAGYEVYPVNPNAAEIEGRPAFATLAEVPAEHVDRVSVYLPPDIGITLLEDIASLNPDEVWFNPGSHDPALLAEAQAIGLEFTEGCSIVDLGMSPDEFGDD